MQCGENWGWREPNFCWSWGGGDTTHRSYLPLVPPSLRSATQITQTWICEVVWVTPHGQNKAGEDDLGQDYHTQASHKERTMSLYGQLPVSLFADSGPIWIPQCLSLLCHPSWAGRCKALGLTWLTETRIFLWEPLLSPRLVNAWEELRKERQHGVTNIQDPCFSYILTTFLSSYHTWPFNQTANQKACPQHSRGLTTDKYRCSFHTASTLNKNFFPSSISNYLLCLRHFIVQNFCIAFCPRSLLYSTAYQIPVSLNMKNARFNEQICNERQCWIVLDKQAWYETNAWNILQGAFLKQLLFIFKKRSGISVKIKTVESEVVYLKCQ